MILKLPITVCKLVKFGGSVDKSWITKRAVFGRFDKKSYLRRIKPKKLY